MSPEEVALELAKLIANSNGSFVGETARADWLDLYRECLATVKGA